MRENPLRTNSYFRMLAIMDHVNECSDKYRAYKNHAINKDFAKEELRQELDKELVDLFLLLLWELRSNESWNDLLSERKKRFEEKCQGGAL